MYIRVRVTPGAKKERVTRVSETEFDIQVREPAERNMANGRVRTLVAIACGVPEKSVRILIGHHSTTKLLTVEV